MTESSRPGEPEGDDAIPNGDSGSSVDPGSAVPETVQREVATTKALAEGDRALTQARREENDRASKNNYSGQLLTMLRFQVGLFDAAFVAYLIYEMAHRWQIPVGALQVWVSGLVVEVIGLVAIAARDLFPGRKR